MPNSETNQSEVVEVNEDLDAFSGEFFGQNEATVDEPASESAEQEEEVAEPEVGDDDTENEDSVEEEEVVEEEVEDQPKKKTVQDRINELVREREEAKREADKKVEELRKEFEAKIAALTKAEAPKSEETSGEPTPDDLNEDGTPKYDLGEFDPKYIRDLTKYTLEQERQRVMEQAAEEARQTEQRKAQEELASKWNEKVEAAVAEYPDFMQKGQELINKFDGLEESYGTYLSTLLMSMDKGPEVLYYLSNHPEEATQIVNSGAQRATLALGRIEAKFLETTKQEQPKVKTSKAPPPVPAQARARGSNGAFIGVSPDTDDLDAFTKEFFAKKK